MANEYTVTTSYFAYVESVLMYDLLISSKGTNLKTDFIAQKRYIQATCNLIPDVISPLFLNT